MRVFSGWCRGWLNACPVKQRIWNRRSCRIACWPPLSCMRWNPWCFKSFQSWQINCPWRFSRWTPKHFPTASGPVPSCSTIHRVLPGCLGCCSRSCRSYQQPLPRWRHRSCPTAWGWRRGCRRLCRRCWRCCLWCWSSSRPSPVFADLWRKKWARSAFGHNVLVPTFPKKMFLMGCWRMLGSVLPQNHGCLTLLTSVNDRIIWMASSWPRAHPVAYKWQPFQCDNPQNASCLSCLCAWRKPMLVLIIIDIIDPIWWYIISRTNIKTS